MDYLSCMETAKQNYQFDYLLMVEDDMRASENLVRKLQTLIRSSYLGKRTDWILTKLYYSEQLQVMKQQSCRNVPKMWITVSGVWSGIGVNPLGLDPIRILFVSSPYAAIYRRVAEE